MPKNPYGNGRSNNPWGRIDGLDQQRSDLWTLDLAEAQATLASGTVRSLPDVLGMADTTLRFFPESVSLPDQGVAVDSFAARSGTPYPYPGLDEQTQTVRIVFRHEAGFTKGQGQAVPGGSLIYGVLEAWKNLARAGRTAYGNETVSLLPSANGYKPVYRFNVPLRFYAGMNDEGELVQTMSYRLVNAWVRTVQLGELNYANGTGLTVSAQFCCDYLEPASDKVATSSNVFKTLFGGAF